MITLYEWCFNHTDQYDVLEYLDNINLVYLIQLAYCTNLAMVYSSKCINLTFAKSMLHKIILVTHNLKVEDRRRKVATLLAQSMTELEIAQELKVDQSTISRDIKVLKKLSQRFVFDLAKSD
jgi:DNA-binding NarL/FixJ family response regulator